MSQRDAAPDDATFDVLLLGFDTRAQPNAKAELQRVFGIDGAAAQRLLLSLPRTVKRRVSRVRAEYFRRALALIGGEVVVRDRQGKPVQPADELPAGSHPAPARPPVPGAGSSPRAADRGLALGDRRVDAAPIGATGRTRDASPSTAAATLGAGGITDGSAPAAPGDRRPAQDTLPEGTRAADFGLPPAIPTPPAGAAGTRLDAPAASPAYAADPAPAAAEPAAGRPGQRPAPSGEGELGGFPGLPAAVLDARPPAFALLPDSPPHLPQNAAAARSDSLLPRMPPHVWSAPDAPRAVVSRGAAAGWDSELPDPLPASGAPGPGPSAAHGALPAAVAALSLDLRPDGPAPRLLGSWEQPSGASMAEPPTALPRAVQRAARASYRPAPPPGVAPAARAAAAARPRPQQPPPPVEPDPLSFWDGLPGALWLPFAGQGLYWIAAVTVWSMAVGALGMVAQFMPLIGVIVMFFAQTSVLGFACDFARVCFWVAPAGDSEVEKPPDFDPARLLHVYIRSGLHLSMFVLLSQAVLVWWVLVQLLDGAGFELLADPLTWMFALLPGLYWPMAVGLTASRNNFAAIWNLPAGVRAILRAPLEYAVIALTGGLLFGFVALGMGLFGSMFGLAAAVLPPAIGLPLVVSHGVMGSLCGRLARARPEVFEE